MIPSRVTSGFLGSSNPDGDGSDGTSILSADFEAIEKYTNPWYFIFGNWAKYQNMALFMFTVGGTLVTFMALLYTLCEEGIGGKFWVAIFGTACTLAVLRRHDRKTLLEGQRYDNHRFEQLSKRLKQFDIEGKLI